MPAGPPKPRRAGGDFSWLRFNFAALPWREMRALDRTAFAVGLGGGTLAIAAAMMWTVCASLMLDADVYGLGWHEYRSGGPGTGPAASYYPLMRALHAISAFGAATALVGLAAAAINANRDQSPRHTAHPLIASAIGCVLGVLALLVIWVGPAR